MNFSDFLLEWLAGCGRHLILLVFFLLGDGGDRRLFAAQIASAAAIYRY